MWPGLTDRSEPGIPEKVGKATLNIVSNLLAPGNDTGNASTPRGCRPAKVDDVKRAVGLKNTPQLPEGLKLMLSGQVVKHERRKHSLERLVRVRKLIGETLVEGNRHPVALGFVASDLEGLGIAVQTMYLALRVEPFDHQGQGACPAAQVEHSAATRNSRLLDQALLKRLFPHNETEHGVVEWKQPVVPSRGYGLELEGLLLTMYDPRNNLCLQVVRDAREHFGERVFDAVIPRNVRLSEAPSHGKPALLYDINSKGARSYLRLAEEVLERMKHGDS